MVEAQLRTNKVTNLRLIEAMGQVPREKFVSARFADVAYSDKEIMVRPDRYLMAPLALARLLQAADVKDHDVVLDVGCSSGYTSAILSQICGMVVGLDEDEILTEAATQTLNGIGADNALVVTGAVKSGHKKQAPYDVIIFSGAVHYLPSTLEEQLAEGGRIVAIMVDAEQMVGRAMLWIKIRGELSKRVICDAYAPVLPSIQNSASFNFHHV